MNCYDCYLTNHPYFCFYNKKAHISQTVFHPPFQLTQTCVQPHTCTHKLQQSRVDTEVTSVYLLSSFLCVWVVLRCLFIVLWVINSSPLSPCCWLRLTYAEKEGCAEWTGEAQVDPSVYSHWTPRRCVISDSKPTFCNEKRCDNIAASDRVWQFYMCDE